MVAEDLKPKVGQADPEPKLAGDQGGEQSVPTTNAEPKDKGGEDAAKPGGKEEVVLTKDSDPELFKLKKDEVHRGDILFLPDSDDRTAYTGVSLHHLPEGIPGHPIVVLAIFPNDYVWFLLISSSIKGWNWEDTSHIRVDSAIHQNSRKSKEQGAHIKCDTACKRFILLVDGKTLKHGAFLNTKAVYTIPLRCLRRTYGSPKAIRPCSLRFAEAAAANAIADALFRHKLYGDGLLGNAFGLRPSILASKTLAGTICWAQPAGDVLKEYKGNIELKGAGPCLIVESNEETANICMIVDQRETQDDSWRYEDLLRFTDICRAEIACHDVVSWARKEPCKPKIPQVFGTFLPQQYIQCFPCFQVSRKELYALPAAYRTGQVRMDDASLDQIKKVREEREKPFGERWLDGFRSWDLVDPKWRRMYWLYGPLEEYSQRFDHVGRLMRRHDIEHAARRLGINVVGDWTCE